MVPELPGGTIETLVVADILNELGLVLKVLGGIEPRPLYWRQKLLYVVSEQPKIKF